METQSMNPQMPHSLSDPNPGRFEPQPPTAPAAGAPPQPYAAQPPGSVLHKSPGIAALLSLMPGLGHIYNGLYQRGMIFFALVAGAISLGVTSEVPLFGVVAFFFWLFSLLDAYRQARLINHGYATDLGLLEQPQRLRPGQGALAAGVALILIGALELLSRFGLWDWSWIDQLWPVVLIAVGVVLVVLWKRERGKSGDEVGGWEVSEEV